jgi:hypothetical protein
VEGSRLHPQPYPLRRSSGHLGRRREVCSGAECGHEINADRATALVGSGHDLGPASARNCDRCRTPSGTRLVTGSRPLASSSGRPGAHTAGARSVAEGIVRRISALRRKHSPRPRQRKAEQSASAAQSVARNSDHAVTSADIRLPAYPLSKAELAESGGSSVEARNLPGSAYPAERASLRPSAPPLPPVWVSS